MNWWEIAIAAVAAAAGAIPMALRWWRVAQLEHYLPGSVVRFALRWWRSSPPNVVLGLGLVGLVPATIALPDAGLWFALAAAGIAAVYPLGLAARAPGSPAWTERLRRVAVTSVVLALVVGTAVGLLAGAGAGLVVALVLFDLAVDGALALLAPLERRRQRVWIDKARARLRQVGPRVVSITGAYGKTTTKEYVRRVLGAAAPTVASPASFNNAMGLARTINDQLAPGTEWLVAEMGTYGPGEVTELCSWIPPDIAAIAAIGPVHLERFGTLEAILRGEAEAAELSDVVVLNVDDPLLAGLADEFVGRGKTVIRAGVAAPDLDVAVAPADDGWEVSVRGTPVGTVPEVPFPTNLAVAVGVGLAAGVPLERLADAFEGAATPDHRQTVARGPGGFWVVDDTYNSNPAGAAAALETLAGLGKGRRVVVTPGMVELGHEQAAANEAFGAAAATIADDVVIVKRTNRAALRRGARRGAANVRFAASRADAVEWVRATLTGDDAVLYENDLPDHYP
ncbi:MAG: Mur ligase family protein [Acidimicrobiia bacterium]